MAYPLYIGVMQSRRSRARSILRATSDLALLEVGADSTRPVPLSVGDPLVVKGHEGWEVRVSVGENGSVEVCASGGAAVRVNDVQVRGVGRARSGDLIALPDRSLLVQRFSSAPATPLVPSSHEAFEQRLTEEVNRATMARGPVSLLIVRSRGLLGDGLAEFLSAPEFPGRLSKSDRTVFVSQAAPATLEFLCPGASGRDADDFREHLSEALGRLGRPFRWGWATTPSEAQHPSTLYGRALDRLFAERLEPADEMPHADPVMVRLWALCDFWAGMQGGVLIHGEVGSGRETLARVIHERHAPLASFVVVRSATFDSALWRASVERARGGALYVRHLDAVAPSDRAAFWAASAFRPMAGTQGPLPDAPPVVVSVPALRDRPLDVLPIAEQVLARLIGLDSRKPRLTASAKAALSAGWMGSVRDLKNTLQRAALLADSSGEVLAEHVASAVARFAGGTARETDLRASLRTVERRTVLETLARTNWNVTEAARVLNLPRRTVVYRMSKLGLKRPATSG